jgi:hypothetical protein
MKRKLLFFLAILLAGSMVPSIAKAQELKGRILLEVQGHGEAWYVNPDDGMRYFLGRPDDAFEIMRTLAMGISDSDFDYFTKGLSMPKRFAGRILLKVEDSGKAYYVNPDDLRPYYLGRPKDAFNLMRQFSLGITDEDLDRVACAADDPYIQVRDQAVVNGQIQIRNVISINNGWVAVYDDYDGPDKEVGYIPVKAGESRNLKITINNQEKNKYFYAALHEDTDQIGTFDYPDSDAPVYDQSGQFVMARFLVK